MLRLSTVHRLLVVALVRLKLLCGQEEQSASYLAALGSDAVKAADLDRVIILLDRLPQ